MQDLYSQEKQNRGGQNVPGKGKRAIERR